MKEVLDRPIHFELTPNEITTSQCVCDTANAVLTENIFYLRRCI